MKKTSKNMELEKNKIETAQLKGGERVEKDAKRSHVSTTDAADSMEKKSKVVCCREGSLSNDLKHSLLQQDLYFYRQSLKTVECDYLNNEALKRWKFHLDNLIIMRNTSNLLRHWMYY